MPNNGLKPDIPEEFLKPYNAAEAEPATIQLWDSSGFANPDKMIVDGLVSPDAEPFSIVLPPPNVTGTLHMGHAAMLAVEDILVRYARMNGKKTLWIPGTDSAAIATQSKVEGEIYKKEKKTEYAEMSVQAYEKALQIYTENKFPVEYNSILNNLSWMNQIIDKEKDENKSYDDRWAYLRKSDTNNLN